MEARSEAGMSTESTAVQSLSREACRAEFVRKREQYLGLIEQGVNIPHLGRDQMRKIRQGLEALFKSDINPLMDEFQPERDDWDGWSAFEGDCILSIYILIAMLFDVVQHFNKSDYRVFHLRWSISFQEPRHVAPM
jgi:hypothetical protein